MTEVHIIIVVSEVIQNLAIVSNIASSESSLEPSEKHAAIVPYPVPVHLNHIPKAFDCLSIDGRVLDGDGIYREACCLSLSHRSGEKLVIGRESHAVKPEMFETRPLD